MGSEEAALARGDADTRLTNALAAVREIIQQWVRSPRSDGLCRQGSSLDALRADTPSVIAQIMFGGKRDRCSIVVVGSEGEKCCACDVMP